MTVHADKNSVTINLESPWIRERLAQVERRFRNFLTSEDGRLYILFGGARSGKTSLLKTIQACWAQREQKTLSVYIDLLLSHVLSSPQTFFEILFEEMCKQHGICYPDPKKVAGFFRTHDAALPDFKEVFEKIVDQKDSKAQGARFLFLLDNADEVCPFAEELCEDLRTLFLGSEYSDTVARQMDIVMTGGLKFYRQMSELEFPNEQQRYNLEVLPTESARAFVETLPGIADYPDGIAEVLRLTGRHPYLLHQVAGELEARMVSEEAWSQDTLPTLVEDWIEMGAWDEETEQWFVNCAETIESQLSFTLYAYLVVRQTLTHKEMMDIARGQMQDAGAGLVAQVRQALDILMFYGLVEQPRRGTYVITSELFKRWFVMTYKDTSGRPTDTYTRYEVGMANVLARMTNQHPRYSEALIYQQRLSENIAEARAYGDTETTRADRAKIVQRINALTLEILGKPLAELD